MDTQQIVHEIKRLPSPPKAKAANDSASWIALEEAFNKLDDRQRLNAFHAVRLAHYEQFISEIGYLPSEFIAECVQYCALALRNLSQLKDNERHNKYSLLYQIRKIGQGIANAETLDLVKHRAIDIKAYSTHDVISSLSEEATAGDCFLFNTIVTACGAEEFKDVSAFSVVEKYFKTFESLKNQNNNESSSSISLALDISTDLIFGVNIAHTLSKKYNSSSTPEHGFIEKLVFSVLVCCLIIWGVQYLIK